MSWTLRGLRAAVFRLSALAGMNPILLE